MQSLENLSVQMKNRSADLIKAKKEGRKVVGYTPGGFLPEELVLASGAIPLGLIRGGEHEVAWLDVTMRNAASLGVMQGRCRLKPDVNDLREGQRAVTQACLQVRAGH